MKDCNAKSCEISSDVVALVIDGDTVDVLSGAARDSLEVAAAVIMVSDDTQG